jgi:hypothetical protein
MARRSRGALVPDAVALWTALGAVVCIGSFGCEASQPKQVENPDPLGIGASAEAEEPESDQVASEEGSDESRDEPAESVNGKELGGDPKFENGMSVDQAIKAVPPGADRLEIEQDRLAQPLQEAELYEPCKLGAGHFKARVAVWNGRAVGVDIETQPHNPTLARCIDQQIREAKWSDRVRSLNTVEYSY